MRHGAWGKGTFARKLGHVCVFVDFEMNMHGQDEGGGDDGVGGGAETLSKSKFKSFYVLLSACPPRRYVYECVYMSGVRTFRQVF